MAAGVARRAFSRVWTRFSSASFQASATETPEPLAKMPIVDLGLGMREPGDTISMEWFELREGVCERELEGRGIAAREGGRPVALVWAFVGEYPNRLLPAAAGEEF